MEGSSGSSSWTNIGVEDWEAFCEFLRNIQPPRSLSDCTANDVVEFLRRLPYDRLEAGVVHRSAETFKMMFGSHMENPFTSPIVSTFLWELAEEQASKKEYGKKKLSPLSVHMDNFFHVCLTTSDDVYLDFRKKDAEKYFSLPAGGTECVLQFEDEDGKPWMFKYSYNNATQSYVFTQGWSSYVKEKQLVPGDFVFFQPSDKNSSRFFIGYKRRVDILREEQELKEVETPLQLRLPKLKNPILVISSGDDQESEETYFVSYILNELRLRSFTPCRYYLTRRKVTRNPAMLYRSRICIVIVSMNNIARSQKSLDNLLAIMSHLKANKVTLIPVFFELSDDSSKSAHLGDSGQVHLGDSVQK